MNAPSCAKVKRTFSTIFSMLPKFSSAHPQISNRKDLAQFSTPLAWCHFRWMQRVGRCQRREDIVVHFCALSDLYAERTALCSPMQAKTITCRLMSVCGALWRRACSDLAAVPANPADNVDLVQKTFIGGVVGVVGCDPDARRVAGWNMLDPFGHQPHAIMQNEKAWRIG